MLNVEQLTKRYGKIAALDSVSLRIGGGECFCLLGRNGAGKSTLIGVLAGLVRPDSGRVAWDGLAWSEHSLAIKKRMGVLPDRDPSIGGMTGAEYLDLVCVLRQMPHSWRDTRVGRIAEPLLGSAEVLYRPISSYSRGTRVKISLLAALVHDPALLILDEPFSSLDPVSAAQLAGLLRELRDEGTALLVSSHSLGYVAGVATHIGVLDAGRFLFTGDFERFTASGKQSIEDSLLQTLGVEVHRFGSAAGAGT